eukprot:SAG31_NODE_15636_length_745_cov_1.160991_2_plen_22_part_01
MVGLLLVAMLRLSEGKFVEAVF